MCQIPNIDVVRLHGIYGGETAAVPPLTCDLRTRCLALKFVHNCSASDPWCKGILRSILSVCDSSLLSRLLLLRIPEVLIPHELLLQIVKEQPDLKRVVIQSAGVTVEGTLSFLQKTFPSSHSSTLRSRLSEEQRDKLKENKPVGREFIIVGKEQSTCSTDAPFHWPPVQQLIYKVYHLPLVSFCYEAQGVRVLLEPTSDVRLHLPLPAINDEAVENGSLTPLLPALATAQYLLLHCSYLSPKYFERFVVDLNLKKTEKHGDVPVMPFHVSVIAKSTTKKFSELEKTNIKKALQELTCLNYASFKVLDDKGEPDREVKKTHKGDVIFPKCRR